MTDATFAATIRLGVVVSAVAAGSAAGLSLIGDVSRWSFVIAVAIAAFVASWVQTGRVARTEDHELAPLVADTRLDQALG